MVAKSKKSSKNNWVKYNTSISKGIDILVGTSIKKLLKMKSELSAHKSISKVFLIIVTVIK